MLDELRQHLARLQKPAGLVDGPAMLPFGIPAVDEVLGGGLARGSLHEISALSEAHLPAATGFALGLAGLTSSSFRGARETGEPGIQKPFPNARLDSGAAPLARPGMTTLESGEVKAKSTSSGSPRTWRWPRAARRMAPASTPSAFARSGCSPSPSPTART